MIDVARTKELSKKLYYLTLMLQRYTKNESENLVMEEFNTVAVFSRYLAEIACELYDEYTEE